MGIQKIEMPFISVVVITLNRKEHLKRCLNSIFNLDYPPERFEVIVVDGDSSDNTKEMVTGDFPNAKFIVEKRKGIPYARNTGWKYAKGMFVAYTDDDCLVDKSWLKSLICGFTSVEIGAVGGPVQYLHPELISKDFYQTPVGLFNLGEKGRLLKPHENLITANIAIRSEVFRKTEFFESLVYSDSEDYEFCWSLMEAGFKLKYMPNAKVFHDINPKRVSMYYLLRRAFYSGISHYIVARRRNPKGILISKFLRAFLGGLLDFFRGNRFERRVANFFWFSLCFVAFLSSILLIYKDF